MKRPYTIISVTFVLTLIAGVLYSIYLFMTVHESGTLVVPFVFIAITGMALFIESILFSLLFYKHLSTTWVILLPVFLMTSTVPIYFCYDWYSNRPVDIPLPGQLPVSIDRYEADSKLIIEDYLQNEVDSNSINNYGDTIQSAFIDTIFYSTDKTKFFAIIVAIAKYNDEVEYCSIYRVGRLVSDKWQLGKPKGNVWSTCFQSIDNFKYELRQYYYKKYSINNSSDKPEIWTDKYIFKFEDVSSE